MTDDELIDLLKRSEEWADRPFTHATELAEETDITRQGIRERLENLVEKTENVKRYKPSRDVIYYYD